MNAVTSTLGKPSKPGAFKWLIKREFWENRGGFFWAPVITGGIAVSVLMFAVTATNAVVNQPQRHPRPLFETRSLAPLGETRTPGLADLFVAIMKGTYA